MTARTKILNQVLRGDSDHNLLFEALCNLLVSLGFSLRIRGDHHIFYREGIPEILNLQPKQGKAKAYQVKQVRELIIRYKLGVGHDD